MDPVALAAPMLSMMTPGDIPEVMAVERAAYSAGWPPTAFERELAQNAMARYVVVRESPGAPLAGFAGLWLMVDEAHVVTVAVVPEARSKGLGNLLVHGLVLVAVEHGMALATLEVRPSNEVARRLYRRFGFYEVGTRKRYYADNHEDAVIMTTEDIQGVAYRQRLETLAESANTRYPGVNLRPAGLAVPP